MPTAIHRFPQHLINVFYQYLALQNIKNYKYITKAVIYNHHLLKTLTNFKIQSTK